MPMVICVPKKFIICIVILYRAGGSNLHVVRPNLVRHMGSGVRKHAKTRGVWGHASPGKVGNFIFIPSETASGGF